MKQEISSQVLAQVFSLSPGAMLTLADMLRAEAVKKENRTKEEDQQNG